VSFYLIFQKKIQNLYDLLNQPKYCHLTNNKQNLVSFTNVEKFGDIVYL